MMLLILILNFLILQAGGSALSSQQSCSALPPKLTFNANDTLWTYNAQTASLHLNFDNYLFFSQDWCSVKEESYHPYFRIDLISTSRRRQEKDLKSREAVRERCRKLKKGSYVQSSTTLHVNQTQHTFQYVQGMYYMRLVACKDQKCLGQDQDLICSASVALFASKAKNKDVCDLDMPSNVSAQILDNNSRFFGQIQNTSQSWYCDIALRATIPLCTAQQSYDTVTVKAVEVQDQESKSCNFEDYFASNHSFISQLKPLPCLAKHNCNNGSTNLNKGVLEHEISGISRNATYCLFFKLNNPHCRGEAGCVFYTQPLTCDLIRNTGKSGLFTSLVTQPVFIGVVSGTLFLSLALLAWTVIQCSKKKPGTPLISSSQSGNNHGNNLENSIKKPPPRSLTEDDLEHISRLPSQEIVLVYFPDTTRFKDLNRKLRNWLVTLDVNDVKDIYDEKCSEEVLKDPEGWVRKTLAGPEKRIILVCSKLAYECLVCVKKGISSPKFVETDPHFGLLTRTIQYLDREMRGNYRNLICVRYDDLKICSRNYSSDAFNIVPGTEYVLPQHLEDVYRWIHPVDPKPECWNENKSEVKNLLDTIRQYRHHDENIFTVQFSDEPNDPANVHTPLTGAGVQVPHPENQSPFTRRRLQITQNL